MANDIHAANNIMTRLATGTQKWANLCDIIAQSIAFHKCIVQVLSFTNVESSLKIDYETQYKMSLEDSKGPPPASNISLQTNPMKASVFAMIWMKINSMNSNLGSRK